MNKDIPSITGFASPQVSNLPISSMAEEPIDDVMRKLREGIERLPECGSRLALELAWSKAVLQLASEYPASFNASK